MSQQGATQPVPVTKRWWQSTTVIFAAIAGGCVALDGFLQQPMATSMAASIGVAQFVNPVEMILEGVAFLASGGAIRGRLMAKLPIR